MNALHRTRLLPVCAVLLAAALPAMTVPAARAAGTADERADAAIAQLEATAVQLRQRIEHVKDVDQVERMVAAYGYYIDKHQWDQLADLFAQNGTMEVSRRGIYVGKPSIRRALEIFGGPPGVEPGHLHNHFQIQPVIHIAPDGSRAWVRNRVVNQLGTFEGSGVWGDGVYENELVKEAGVWKYSKDHLYTTFFVNYDDGWLNGGIKAPGPSDKLPPDRPSSEVYEAYPDVYIPPYHYRHPVTGAPIDATGSGR